MTTNNEFRYDMVLQTEAREVLQDAEQKIRAAGKRAVESVVVVGQELLRAKEEVNHGQFTDWIRDRLGMPDRSARKYMQVAEKFGSEKIPNNVDVSALYLLAAPSTPDDVVEEAKAEAAAGKPVTQKSVKNKLKPSKVDRPACRDVDKEAAEQLEEDPYEDWEPEDGELGEGEPEVLDADPERATHDDLGNELTKEGAIEAFSRRHEIQDLLKEAQALRRKMKALDVHPAATHLDYNGAMSAIVAVVQSLKACIPYCTVPTAVIAASPQYASFSYLTKRQYDALPESERH